MCAGPLGAGVSGGGGYRFSAFWLRSSVVSVLISLISDTSSMRGLYIKRIFGRGSRSRGLLHPLRASSRYCSASGLGAPLRGPCAVQRQSECLWGPVTAASPLVLGLWHRSALGSCLARSVPVGEAASPESLLHRHGCAELHRALPPAQRVGHLSGQLEPLWWLQWSPLTSSLASITSLTPTSHPPLGSVDTCTLASPPPSCRTGFSPRTNPDTGGLI